MSQAPITLYTSPGCPDCAAIKQWLRGREIAFIEKDLSAPGVAEEARSRYGVRVAPITVIGERFFYGTFEQQRPQLQRVLER